MMEVPFGSGPNFLDLPDDCPASTSGVIVHGIALQRKGLLVVCRHAGIAGDTHRHPLAKNLSRIFSHGVSLLLTISDLKCL
jgi:hypothetical protein